MTTRLDARSMLMAWMCCLAVFSTTHGAVVVTDEPAAEAGNLALHKPYTWSRPPLEGRRSNGPGDEVQLTDGEYASHFQRDPGTLFFNESPIITIDLGSRQSIGEVVIAALGNAHLRDAADGYFPFEMAIFVSDDLENFHLIEQWRRPKYDRDSPFWERSRAYIRFTDMQTAGRYVSIAMSGEWMSIDEISVFAGSVPVDQVRYDSEQTYASPALNPIYSYDQVYLSKDAVFPTYFQEHVLQSMAVDVPEGVSIVGARPVTETDDAYPELQPGYERLIVAPMPGYVFFETDWPAGERDRLYFHAEIDGRMVSQRVAMSSVHIPSAARPKLLSAAVGWESSDLYNRWPEFLTHYGRRGLNVVDFMSHDTLSSVPNPPLDRLIGEAVRQGFHITGNTNAFHVRGQYVRADSSLRHAQDDDSREGDLVCPLAYLETAGETDRQLIANAPYHGISQIFIDNESAYRDGLCFCPVCKSEFQSFLASKYPNVSWVDPAVARKTPDQHIVLLEAWDDFRGEIGARIYRRYHDSFMKAIEETGADTGFYKGGIGYYSICAKPYHNPFLKFENLREAGVLAFSNPVFYWQPVSATRSDVQANRHLMGSTDTIGWVTAGIAASGRYNNVPCLHVRQTLREVFVNGARGFNLFRMKGVEGHDWAEIATVMRELVPVEKILVEGEPLVGGGITTTPNTIIRGQRLGQHYVILISDPTLAGEFISLETPAMGDSFVVNLHTKQVIGEVAEHDRMEYKVVDCQLDDAGDALLLICSKSDVKPYLAPLVNDPPKDGITNELHWFPGAIQAEKYHVELRPVGKTDWQRIALEDEGPVSLSALDLSASEHEARFVAISDGNEVVSSAIRFSLNPIADMFERVNGESLLLNARLQHTMPWRLEVLVNGQAVASESGQGTVIEYAWPLERLPADSKEVAWSVEWGEEGEGASARRVERVVTGFELPPFIEFTALQEGQTISENVSIEAKVFHLLPVRVDFYIDGEKVHSEGMGPYYCFGDYQKWQISEVADGPHVIRAVAMTSDHSEVEKTITVNVVKEKS